MLQHKPQTCAITLGVIIMKTCTKCKITKPFSEYNKSKQAKSGLKPRCRECQKEDGQEWRDNNPDNKREYYLKNRQTSLDNSKKYAIRNRDKLKEYNKEYYKENKQIAISNAREYALRNKDKIAEYKKAWVKKHEVRLKANHKKYRQTEAYKISKANSTNKRRVLKINSSDGTIPTDNLYPLTQELEYLLELQDYKCNNCDCDITQGKHLDHHIPLSKGGTHSINNVVWLCPTCNMRKSDKMPDTLMLV